MLCIDFGIERKYHTYGKQNETICVLLNSQTNTLKYIYCIAFIHRLYELLDVETIITKHPCSYKRVYFHQVA